ncbi:M23 family metallopeptidase [Streptomyces fragilis]|uniref:Peptidoglycan DD-metalloendopeptidase family protein n=1 Tax=Streptomyces fragilis TaxID=67301 RepID=A0ABV2YHF2_9ACTN|nr:peptidoglycan DD-metalloendopeptidase family protein [Streptomyces fragilis]
MHRRRVAGLISAVLALVSVGLAVPGTAQAAPRPSVTTAVTQKLLDRDALAGRGVSAQDTRVRITREKGGRWAFGTAVVVAPRKEGAAPTGAVFVARAEGGDWTVAFDGEPAFADLAAASPVVTTYEKKLFASADTDASSGEPVQPLAGGDYRTGMALPWSTGVSWTLTGGGHQWDGASGPYSSVDFAGGDQAVRAARAGAAYTLCSGFVRVIHDRGYASDYYHLTGHINANGTSVAQGTLLGYTGTNVACGGSATGRHVHFGLRQNNAYVPIADHGIGGWVFYTTGSYAGYAMHGSTTRGTGSALHNYGAMGLTQGIVDSNGGGTVNKRSGPGTGYAVVGSVADGAFVTVSCSRNGTSHEGRFGVTSLWDRLSDGTWISDAYLWTGYNGAVNGTC